MSYTLSLDSLPVVSGECSGVSTPPHGRGSTVRRAQRREREVSGGFGPLHGTRKRHQRKHMHRDRRMRYRRVAATRWHLWPLRTRVRIRETGGEGRETRVRGVVKPLLCGSGATTAEGQETERSGITGKIGSLKMAWRHTRRQQRPETTTELREY